MRTASWFNSQWQTKKVGAACYYVGIAGNNLWCL